MRLSLLPAGFAFLFLCTCSTSDGSSVFFGPVTIDGDPVANAAGVVVERPLFRQLALPQSSQGPMDGVGTARYLSRLTLTLEGPTTSADCGTNPNWSFIETASFRIEGPEGSTLPAVTIAQGRRPGCVPTFVLLPLVRVDLQPYLSAGARLSGTSTGVPLAGDVSARGNLELDVNE